MLTPASSTRERKALTLLIVALAVAVVVSAVMLLHDRPRGAAQTDALDYRAHDPVRLSRSAAEPALRKAVKHPGSSSDGTITVLVKDRWSRPLANASVVLARADLREVSAASGEVAAHSDQAGRATLGVDAQRFAERKDWAIYCHLEGFMTAEVVHPEPGSIYEVFLQQGNELSLAFATPDGSPIRGLGFVVSRATMGPPRIPATDPGLPLRGDLFPGADNRTAIFRGTSDPAGTAVLTGVPPGRYSLYCQSLAYAPVAANADLMQIRVPSQQVVRVVVHPLVASVWKTPKDVIASRRSRWSSPVMHLQGPGGYVLSSALRHLQSVFPQYSVEVCVPGVNAAKQFPERLTKSEEFYYVGTGWSQVEREYQPVAVIRPFSFPPPGGTGNGGDFCSVFLDGPEAWTGLGLFAKELEEGFVVPLGFRSETRLPPGEYAVLSADPLLRERLRDSRIHARSGGRVMLAAAEVLDASRELRPLRVFLNPAHDGDALGHVYCLALLDGRRVSHRTTAFAEYVDLWVPAGDIVVAAQAYGYRVAQRQVDTRPAGRHEVALDLYPLASGK